MDPNGYIGEFRRRIYPFAREKLRRLVSGQPQPIASNVYAVAFGEPFGGNEDAIIKIFGD